MAGTRLLHRPIDRLERLPATLGQDRSKPELARHPGRHLRGGPQAAVRGWLTQTSLELLQQGGPQDGGTGAVPAPQIAQSLRTLGVIAGEQTLDPSSRIRHRGRDLGNLVPFGQKPDRLKVSRRDHVRAGPVLLLQSRNAQMIGHMRHGSPPRLMTPQPIRGPNRRESLPAPLAGDRMTGQTFINGVDAARGVGADVMGHPHNALAWLANNLVGRGKALRAGQIVLTGSLVQTQWPAPQDEVVVTIAGLGTVSLTFSGVAPIA